MNEKYLHAVPLDYLSKRFIYTRQPLTRKVGASLR